MRNEVTLIVSSWKFFKSTTWQRVKLWLFYFARHTLLSLPHSIRFSLTQAITLLFYNCCWCIVVRASKSIPNQHSERDWSPLIDNSARRESEFRTYFLISTLLFRAFGDIRLQKLVFTAVYFRNKDFVKKKEAKKKKEKFIRVWWSEVRLKD